MALHLSTHSKVKRELGKWSLVSTQPTSGLPTLASYPSIGLTTGHIWVYSNWWLPSRPVHLQKGNIQTMEQPSIDVTCHTHLDTEVTLSTSLVFSSSTKKKERHYKELMSSNMKEAFLLCHHNLAFITKCLLHIMLTFTYVVTTSI